MQLFLDILTTAGLLAAIAAGLWAGAGHWLAGVLVGGVGVMAVLVLAATLQMLLVNTDIPIRRFGDPPD